MDSSNGTVTPQAEDVDEPNTSTTIANAITNELNQNPSPPRPEPEPISTVSSESLFSESNLVVPPPPSGKRKQRILAVGSAAGQETKTTRTRTPKPKRKPRHRPKDKRKTVPKTVESESSTLPRAEVAIDNLTITDTKSIASSPTSSANHVLGIDENQDILESGPLLQKETQSVISEPSPETEQISLPTPLPNSLSASGIYLPPHKRRGSAPPLEPTPTPKYFNSGRGFWSIPKDWLGCPKISTNLTAGKFVAFKTPLRSEKFDDKLEQGERWHIDHILNHTETTFKKKLGLWIDLTFTDKYFDKSIIQQEGIEYFKLKMQGKGSEPPTYIVNQFLATCEQFIKSNPNALIGVHCTHGHNRTGFLIVSYLAQCMGYKIEDAIKEFSLSKPPGIYRQNYVDILFEKYRSRNNLSLPPLITTPSWTFDSKHVNSTVRAHKRNDDIKEFPSNSKRRRSNENFRNTSKSTPLFFGYKKLAGAVAITNDVKSLLLNDISGLLELPASRFLSKPGTLLTEENRKLLNQHTYKLSWLTNSTRYLLWIKCYTEVYFIDSVGSVFRVPNLTFPGLRDLGNPQYHLRDTLCIGEMTNFNISRSAIPTFVIQDVLLLNGQQVHSEPFYRRHAIVKDEILNARIIAKYEGFISKSTENNLHLRYKKFYRMDEAEHLLNGTIRPPSGLYSPPNGLIFVAQNQPFSFDNDTSTLLRWKKSMSVDFKIRSSTISTNLYVSEYAEPFTSTKLLLHPLENRIGEFKYDQNTGDWVFMQEKDSSVPSSVEDANETIETSIREPLSKDRLLSFIERPRLSYRDS